MSNRRVACPIKVSFVDFFFFKFPSPVLDLADVSYSLTLSSLTGKMIKNSV